MDRAGWDPLNWKGRFFTIWSGQQLSWIGSAVAQFALVWWVTKTTGSATVLATATLVSMLPMVILGPFIGALVDRWKRRWVMVVADGVIALASAWLAYLFWIEALQIWHVYVIMLVRALGSAFHMPAMQASTPLMVPDKHLPRVAGINQTIGGAVGILSPVLGALLLDLLPLHTIMAIDVVTAAFSVGPLLVIDVPQPRKRAAATGSPAPQSTLWQEVKAGFNYIRAWPGLMALCLVAMLLNFVINPAMSLLPLLVTNHFQGEALYLGWLNSAWGVGMLVGGVILSAWGGFKRRVVTMLMGVGGFGLGLLLVGLAPATLFPLAVAGLFIGAAMNAMTNGVAFALLQSVVSPEMQGRVFMVIMSLVNMMSPLSMAVAGPLADAVGIRPLYLVAGGTQILLAGFSFFWPVLMRLEADRAGQTGAVEMVTAELAGDLTKQDQRSV